MTTTEPATTVDLLPCPCGAPADVEEAPYAITRARDLYRMNCIDSQCGWSCIGTSADDCKNEWNRRAIDRGGGHDAKVTDAMVEAARDAWAQWNLSFGTGVGWNVVAERQRFKFAIEAALGQAQGEK